MKKLYPLLCLLLLTPCLRAGLITSVPGPDDQGGMIMPMVTIEASAGTGANPTAGQIRIAFTPATPLLKPLQQWSPGSWFNASAAWTPDLGSPAGVGGTPALNAGNGDLFNNQFGFMFMAMGTMMSANIPSGKSLAIKLIDISSPLLESYNYGNAANRWDQVFPILDSQVLWSGSMWHNYFTLPESAPLGGYSATFEVFIANAPFTGTTGFAQYDATALAATKDTNFTAATVNYTWNAVPEPSTWTLLCLTGLVGFAFTHVWKRRQS